MLGPAQLLPREEAKANTAGIHDADADTDADSRRRPKKEGGWTKGYGLPRILHYPGMRDSHVWVKRLMTPGQLDDGCL